MRKKEIKSEEDFLKEEEKEQEELQKGFPFTNTWFLTDNTIEARDPIYIPPVILEDLDKDEKKAD